jgi:MarR family transcriptional regulator, lower aerobic nicotinate degradation pathway regulator
VTPTVFQLRVGANEPCYLAGVDHAPGRHAPARLRGQTSWLINQVALPANRLVGAELAAAGTRRYHYSLLAALDEVGPASQAELSRRTTIDRSDMVAAINELVEQRYVARSADQADRRRNVVSMTPAGRRRLDDLDRLLAGVQDRLLAPLSPVERTQLVALLTRLVDHNAGG